ncbi:hypothetical protein CSKR_106460 [Clonorchis sinensis]|uniref:Uncharacterized protein n=1 Tax=Clonorchis sinensis TaxID=79923 RepID=A0A3R7GTW5_CLOSI|nr:hypothetical protein CSKR_106460 [Clonorchis sinensis]
MQSGRVLFRSVCWADPLNLRSPSCLPLSLTARRGLRSSAESSCLKVIGFLTRLKWPFELFRIYRLGSISVNTDVAVFDDVWEKRWLRWLEREFTDRKVRGSNPTSACRLPLSRLGHAGSIPALVLLSDGMAAGHRKGVTTEQLGIEVDITSRSGRDRNVFSQDTLHSESGSS